MIVKKIIQRTIRIISNMSNILIGLKIFGKINTCDDQKKIIVKKAMLNI